MAEETLKNVTLRVPEALHKPARLKLAELDTSFQQVITALLEEWVAGKRTIQIESSAAPESRKHAAEIADLEFILENGTKDQIQWLRSTLKNLVEGTKFTDLGPDEKRLLEEYRRASWEKRRQILALTAKIEDLAPELMPPARTASKPDEKPKSALQRRAK